MRTTTLCLGVVFIAGFAASAQANPVEGNRYCARGGYWLSFAGDQVTYGGDDSYTVPYRVNGKTLSFTGPGKDTFYFRVTPGAIIKFRNEWAKPTRTAARTGSWPYEKC